MRSFSGISSSLAFFALALLIIAGLFLSVPLLHAQEGSQSSIDDLFDQPEEETEVEEAVGDETNDQSEENASSEPVEAEANDKVDIDELTTSPVKFSGSVNAGVGLGAGLIEWPGTSAADGQSAGELMRYSGFYQTTATVKLDARPQPYLRFYSSLQTTLNDDAMSFDALVIKEIFVDYTLADTVFFRAGQQSLTWGQGRLLGNPANLVSRVSDGVALRSTLPAGPGTLNGVIYSKKSWLDDGYAKHNPKAFAYAGQWETTAGPLSMALAGHFKIDDDAQEDIGSSLSLSVPLGPVDAAADVVGHWARHNPANPPWKPAEWQAMGRILWENSSRSWTLLGEYQFDSTVEAGSGHYGALALKTPKLAGSDWRPALRWKHAFQDNSGELVAGIGGTIAPKLKMSIGVPLIYGAYGSFYRQALEDSTTGDADEDDLTPIDNVATFLLSISLSFSF
ncbi:MAG: hypothetical protein K9L66_05690 [Spirochaetaceae bacterium]|nr:hypothetical protein [Spirochaetaceae bacterium]MCF7938737.1 hypothetical protein [Spirochaetales bacterium]